MRDDRAWCERQGPPLVHLDTVRFTTWIEGEAPRVECPTARDQAVQRAVGRAGLAVRRLFEPLVVDPLRVLSITGRPGCVSLGRGSGVRTRRQAELGAPGSRGGRAVDEKAIGKGDRYLTIVAARDAQAGHANDPASSAPTSLPTCAIA
jgi:hypothetical protein